MKLYRYEHVDTGLGPLCGEHAINWRCVFDTHSAPMWFSEFIEFADMVGWDHRKYLPNTPYRFGSISFDKMMDLVIDEEAIKKHGFVLYEYEVEEEFCVFDEWQIVFNRDKIVSRVRF